LIDWKESQKIYIERKEEQLFRFKKYQ